MIDLSAVATKLEALGVKHAPEQSLTSPKAELSLRWKLVGGHRRPEDSSKIDIDGRYVTLKDEPGVYYILGTDNAKVRRRLTKDVQLIFLLVPTQNVGRYAAAIGYRYKRSELLPSAEGYVYSVIMEPL